MDFQKIKHTFNLLLARLATMNIVKFVQRLLVLGALGGTFAIAYILYAAHDLPDIGALENIKKGRKVTILDNNGHTLSTYGNIYGYYVPYEEIPKNLVNAIIAIEDRNFFGHPGVDVLGILRAALVNFKAGRVVQGGSTITQQLAKITLLSPERTFKRKIQEALLSLELEKKYTKEQLLSIYLNRVYLGVGIYGIDAAAKYYFGKNIHNLNLYECAIIAGLPKAPSRFSPMNNPELSGQRAYQVLTSMFEAGYITKAQLDEAEKQVSLNTSLFGSKEFGHFTNWVYETVGNYVEVGDVDITIRTTLDRHIQKVAQSVLNRYLDEFGAEKKVSQGAILVMTPNGKIVAMVGGKSFSSSQFNLVTQALRPAGSSFKLFVYTAAIEKGYPTDTIFEDKPIRFGTWAPMNYNNDFRGEVTMTQAFASSINTVSVQVANKVGIGNVIDVAHRMGISTDIEYNLSVALGTTSVSLLELTSAYATIANDGVYSKPYSIDVIKNSTTGSILYFKRNSRESNVITEETAKSMQDMLRSCVLEGSAKAASIANFKISGKTGTSQDYRDAWFLGFSDKYVIGVRLGNDDYSPMNKVAGGGLPTRIARDILKAIG
jgi:penicillin-binding protein 1A